MRDLLIVSAVFAGKVVDGARDITATFANRRVLPLIAAATVPAYLAAKYLEQAPLPPVI